MTDRDDAVPTGPRTDADPSRNAVTHGLTARRPLCEEEAERLRVLVDSWTAKHTPETEAEEALVQSAAVEYVRYLRCVQADERQMGPAAREALAQWREKRRHAIRRKAQDLRDDPARVAAELHESAFGIDWLLGQWRRLLGLLEPGRGWLGDEMNTAMHLMGREPRRPEEGDVDARWLWETAWLACPSAFDVQAQRGLVDAAAADRLREFVADRIARLEALRPLAWEEEEGPQAEAIEAAAMLDTSKVGQLRQRYRREALRDMHKGISMLIRLRVERSKIDDRLVRQERMTRTSSGPGRRDDRDDRPAWTAPASSARPSDPGVVPPATDPPAPPQRNEPPSAPSDPAADRLNPSSHHEIRRDPAPPTADPCRRTAPSPEAHRPRPDGPDPSSRPPGPASNRPADLDRRA